MSEPLSPRGHDLRRLIHDFIAERLSVKLEKLEPESPKYQAEQEKHAPDTWLTSAVARVSQIQVVTHPLKASYSHAHIKETTSLYCRPQDLPQQALVSTAVLGDDFMDDVTGNAAALDIYALLQLQHQEQTLLELCLANDADLQAALHADADVAAQWLAALAEVTQPKMQGVASHTFAKQLYWLTDVDPYVDSNYALLAPLYSSSLAHKVYEQIDFDRFSPEAKEIREAARNKKFHASRAHSYPNLAIQVIGGSNPQGISSLSSKRRGVNYLLSSIPPKWQPQDNRPPLHLESIFQRFEKRADTQRWLHELKTFLVAKPAPNLATRNEVDRLINGVLDELYIFAATFQQLPAGWSADSQCNLPHAQRYWLDPGRALQELEFAEAWLNSDWDDRIERDFGRWLNGQLSKRISYLSDIEFRRWAREMRKDSTWSRHINEQVKRLAKQLARSES